MDIIAAVKATLTFIAMFVGIIIMLFVIIVLARLVPILLIPIFLAIVLIPSWGDLYRSFKKKSRF